MALGPRVKPEDDTGQGPGPHAAKPTQLGSEHNSGRRRNDHGKEAEWVIAKDRWRKAALATRQGRSVLIGSS